MTGKVLVREKEGIWQEWHGDETVQIMATTYTATFHDGRPAEELPCDPYPVEVVINGDKVAKLIATGVWSETEAAQYGGRLAERFAAPEGQHTVGAARYEPDADTGEVRQVYDVEDDPPPPAPPTAEEKLAAAGLTADDLREILGL